MAFFEHRSIATLIAGKDKQDNTHLLLCVIIRIMLFEMSPKVATLMLADERCQGKTALTTRK